MSAGNMNFLTVLCLTTCTWSIIRNNKSSGYGEYLGYICGAIFLSIARSAYNHRMNATFSVILLSTSPCIFIFVYCLLQSLSECFVCGCLSICMFVFKHRLGHPVCDKHWIGHPVWKINKTQWNNNNVPQPIEAALYKAFSNMLWCMMCAVWSLTMYRAR